MTYGATLGRMLCIGLVSSAGFGIGIFADPFLFVVADLRFGLTPHELPFQWVDPMIWTALTCAVLGACLGGFFAWQHFRTASRRSRRHPTCRA